MSQRTTGTSFGGTGATVSASASRAASVLSLGLSSHVAASGRSTPAQVASQAALSGMHSASHASMQSATSTAFDDSPPEWSPDTNALTESVCLLPQPYRRVHELLRDVILGGFWDEIERRRDEAAPERRKTGIQIEGQEEDEPTPLGRVQYSQQVDVKAADLLAVTPSRVVAPVFPSGFGTAAASPSILASCASLSLDGRVGLIGSKHGLVYVLDLSRGFNFMYFLNGEGQGPDGVTGASSAHLRGEHMITSVAVSGTPILRGDEDLLAGDEAEHLFNYTIAWASASPVGGQVVRVATMNAHSWTFYEGCSITLPRGAAAACALTFSPDASHLSVTTADASVSVYALRAHRYDARLEPPKMSQKELLGNAKLAAAAAASLSPPIMGARPTVDMAAMHLASAAELSSVLAEHDFHTSGVTCVEARAVTHLQPKLYTSVLLLQAAPPRHLIPTPPPSSSSANVSSMPSSGAASPTPAMTRSPKPKRSSLRMEKDVPGEPVDLTTLATPVASVAVNIIFLHSSRERALAQLAAHVTRGCAIAWIGDHKWHQWDLPETMPIVPLAAATGASSQAQPPLPVSIAEKPDRTVAGKKGATAKDSAPLAVTVVDPAADARLAPAHTFVLGSALTAVCADVGTRFLAFGLSNGSAVLHDTRLGCERAVLNATPVLSHSHDGAHAVSSLSFFHASHLVVGCADHTLRTFFLPTDLSTKVDHHTMEHCQARISAKLPGRVRSVHIGTSIAVAVIGIEAASSVDAATPAPASELFVYDFVSNFIIGKVMPGIAAPASDGSASSRSLLRGGHESMDFGGTADFTVHQQEEKEDGSFSARTSKALGLPLRQLTNARTGSLELRSSRSNESSIVHTFHTLASNGCLATIESDQLVMLGSSGGSSNTCVLVYSLSHTVEALYPSIVTACPNGFLRQQHAVELFQHYAQHAARRTGHAWHAFMDHKNAIVAQSNQRQLHQAFKQGRSPSAMGSTAGDGRRRSSGAAPPRRTSKFQSGALSHISSREGSMLIVEERDSSRSPSGVFPSLFASLSNSISGTPARSGMRSGPGHSSNGSIGGRSALSSGGGSHARGHSRGRSQRAPPPPPSMPPNVPRDAAFLVHEQLALAASTAADRAVHAKARRIELQQQVKQQQRDALRYAGGLRATNLPPIAQR